MRITEPYTIFLRKLPSGRSVYYYQFRDEYGRRSAAYSTGTDNSAKAKRIVRQLYNDGKFVSSGNTNFGSFVKSFFSDDGVYVKSKELKGEKVKKNTLIAYRKVTENQLKPFFGNIRIDKINTGHILDFKAYYLEQNLSKKTINQALQTLSVVLKKAAEKDLIVKLPKIDFFTVEKKSRELLTVDELKKIISVGAEVKNKVAFLAMKLLACTGLRIGEALALKPENIYENYLDIKFSFSDSFGLDETKTKTCRKVPIPKGMYDELKTIGNEEWVFFDKSKIVRETVKIYFYQFLEKVGIEREARGITLHSLRAFFISHLREKNISDAKIRAVVGHSDPTMTNVYTYWKPEMFPEVYEVQKELYEKINEGVQNERIS